MPISSSTATYVLGTGLSHDGSACLVKDGRVAVAIGKERLTRRKHDGMNDAAAIKYCLEAAGIRGEDLSLIVQNANFSMFERGNDYFHGVRNLPEGVPVVTISHHLAHAYSAMGTAPFDDMAIIVVDGCGNAFDECIDVAQSTGVTPAVDVAHLYFEKDSYYIYRDGRLKAVFKDFSPWGKGMRGYSMLPPTTQHSIGGVYSAISRYVFRNLDDAGKLMGLAPYGRALYTDPMFDLVDGRVFVRYDWMKAHNRPAHGDSDFRANFQYYADLARWAQGEIERALLYVFRSRFEMQRMPNVAYAGGVALNAVANARLRKEGPFDDLYVQPAPGDDGLAIGCAYYGWLEVLEGERIRHDGSTYLGRTYTKAEIVDALWKYSSYLKFRSTPEYLRVTAQYLAAEKVIAWFQGGAEFGPRALGHRSILASPRSRDIGRHINRDIKFREDFRPFAPAVTAESAGRYFECDFASPYMILTAPVRPEYREVLAAVVHEDGSARLQTVTREANPAFHELLSRFGELSGVPVLLNTSLNRRGMPIVESPLETVEFFLECDLDILVIDNYVVEKA